MSSESNGDDGGSGSLDADAADFESCPTWRLETATQGSCSSSRLACGEAPSTGRASIIKIR
ncbi:hypothetical protein H4217_009486 [Coemansia sp. RSA 1939]|nr:hypothetical protein H4217_009486 [Coemansia sp. RSA 1939]